MGKILILLLILIICSVLWALPLYISVNLVLWLFHIPYHLTIFQSIGLCCVGSVLSKILFKKGGN